MPHPPEVTAPAEVTLLFCDIEGSTRLVQDWGHEYAEALGRHRDLLRAALGDHDGREVDSQGDSFLAAFEHPGHAVAGAVAAQRALARHRWPGEGRLRVRMGVHTGTPVWTDQGWIGIDVHRGARICSAAHGGQVLLSDATRSRVPAAAVRDLGRHRLVGLADPVRLFQVLAPDLDADFPPLRAARGTSSTLPVALTPLLGREADLTVVADLVPAHRLVTLTGPGGIGKTRLAVEAARTCLEAFPGGAFFVDLAATSDPDLVLPAVAGVVGVPERGAASMAQALLQRGPDEPFLLVLDNLEQVAECAPLLSELISLCPTLHVLATSRVALRISGERLYRVPPLEPEPAVDLFVQRATEKVPDFPRRDRSTPIRAICERLDHLPLAIELAAVRVDVLPPEALLTRLERALPMLGRGPVDLPLRHRGLDHAIAWSYDLLAEDEKRLMACLGVFTGGFTVESAEAVHGLSGPGDPQVLDGISSLLEKSLLSRQEDAETGARFTMLETIREFAVGRLSEEPDRDELRRRHADYFVDLAEAAAPTLTFVSGRTWVRRMEQEQGNVRSALMELLATGRVDQAVRLVAAAWRPWAKAGAISEGVELSRLALDACGSQRPPDHSGAVVGLSELLRVSGDTGASRDLKERLLPSLLAEVPPLAYAVMSDLGALLDDLGDVDAARDYHERALRLQEAREVPLGVAHATLGLARHRLWTGDTALARQGYRRALVVARAAGDDEFLLDALVGLATAALSLRQLLLARLHARSAIRQGLVMHDLASSVDAFGVLAAVELEDGDAAQAARLLGALDGLLRRTGVALYLPDLRPDLRDRLRRALPVSRLGELVAEGAALDWRDAAGTALRGGSGPGHLTARP